MKRLMKDVLITLTVLAISYIIPNNSYSEILIKKALKKEIENKILSRAVNIDPQLNKITTGFGKLNAKEFYFIKSPSKLFFQDNQIAVKVIYIDFKNDGIIFHLWNENLGRGRIRFVFSKQTFNQLTLDNVEQSLKFALSSQVNSKVVVNKRSKTFHLHSSNHLPINTEIEEMSMHSALIDGYKPCGYCFVRLTYIPDQHIEYKLSRQGAAIQRYTSPLVVDQGVQAYFQDVGNRVLRRWPLAFIGYEYKFQVLDDNSPYAFALPGGHIMVTSALLSSVENEDELEAILAHEIAHVERRHILRQYILEMETRQAQQTIGIIGAVAAGAAASSNNQSVAAGALGVSMIGIYAMDIYYKGYMKEHEREADDIAILYFEKNKMDRVHLENIFKKIEFLNLATILDPDPGSLTHPYLEERIARVKGLSLRMFINEHFVYFGGVMKSPIQLDLLYQSTYDNSTSLAVYISDYNFIKKILRQSLPNDVLFKIKDENEVHVYSLNKQNITRDTWGAYLMLKAYQPKTINVIKNIIIRAEIESEKAMAEPFIDTLRVDYNFSRGEIIYK